MRICFLWTDISGYMASCWRSLSQRTGIDVRVVTYGESQATAFSDELMAGIDWHRRPRQAELNAFRAVIDEFSPQVLVVPGWLDAAYREAAQHYTRRGVHAVLTMDTPWWGTLRQQLGRAALARYTKLFRYVAVTGERSYQYARRLGFTAGQIHRPLYGVDYRTLSQLLEARLQQEWPRQFLYVGRYAEEKAIGDLVAGYRRYRELSKAPWPLVTCGKGPQETLLQEIEGIDNRGFTQPAEVQRIMQQSAALLLPSHFDPWPLIVVEASAAGLPVVYSLACGSPVEVVRDRYSGFQLGSQTPDAFAATLLEVQQRHAELPDMGRRASAFAAAYSNEFWADRWADLVHRCTAD